ncbi:VWA domain-containing protein [Granulicella sibirica]|uniref:Putative chloride channel n=1 Tax=Granulicella sibirica TaxID=2479048 RepID=A0A4V1L642_9BACT|nr:VWA domain-containing protein [Granulicella sibirica]RXH57954.1 putative chloride channel [Granulicella sibirica]
MIWRTLLLSLIPLRCLCAQVPNQPDRAAGSYRLKVAVDEVSVTFHVADSQGLPINDLKLDEVRLLDNGKPPRRILRFQYLKDFPIRAAILMDTSGSMLGELATDRAISTRYAQRVLRQKTDRALVMDFGYQAEIVQPWTSDASLLAAGVKQRAMGGVNPRGGTALFDTLEHICRIEIGSLEHDGSENFILLFSDGEDTASFATLKQVVGTCQKANTAIYAFHAKPKTSSTGPATLAELAAETGGRVFFSDASEAEVDEDLEMIEADLRNQYRIVYRPTELKWDGTFHRIEWMGSDRVDRVVIRSGYYALEH